VKQGVRQFEGQAMLMQIPTGADRKHGAGSLGVQGFPATVPVDEVTPVAITSAGKCSVYPLLFLLASFETIHSKRHPPPGLSSLSLRQNLPLLYLLGTPCHA
jgi:hypothetical protein